ncbi:MAG: hypothetical protein ACE5G8_07665, partial [Anaerolineae bacterium]
ATGTLHGHYLQRYVAKMRIAVSTSQLLTNGEIASIMDVCNPRPAGFEVYKAGGWATLNVNPPLTEQFNVDFKHITLYLGAPLVAFGSRLLCDEVVVGLPVIVVAALMLLAGQTLARFEDFPRGSAIVAHLDGWLSEKQIPLLNLRPGKFKPTLK